jgi:hypothetical protein
MNLAAEPLVVTLPPVEKERYYSLQLVDLYTNNEDYVGTRVDGNGGGKFLIVGPGWHGPLPRGIKRVIRMATSLTFGQFRTQLFDAADLENVRAIQSGYEAQPLSEYLNTRTPEPPLHVDYPAIDRDSFNP